MLKVYDRIEKIVGNVITLSAQGVKYGELAVVFSERSSSLAEVIRLEGEEVYLQIFGGTVGVSTTDKVRFLGRGMEIPFSENLRGRIFSGSGEPRDHGPSLSENKIPIKTPSINPARRIIPHQMIRTGIPMIDLFNTLVVSQKLPIFSVSGENYNALLSRIAMQAEVDLIVLGGIGLKHDDYLFFRHTLEEGGARGRSISFIHLASDPVVEGLFIPDMALSVAERFALQGKKVLVLLSDMSNYAEALREIAITMDQVPSNRGYPGDLYTQLAVRYEKAVAFMESGSVTILSVTTMPDDDITHPIPDNTGYITEGQLYLKNGRINPFGSLSRLKQLVNKNTRPDHRELMDGMIRLYASSKESQEKRALGFRMTPWDEKLLKYGELFEKNMMDLSVNIPLEKALDLGWEILAQCFLPQETGLRSEWIEQFWPKKKD